MKRRSSGKSRSRATSGAVGKRPVYSTETRQTLGAFIPVRILDGHQVIAADKKRWRMAPPPASGISSQPSGRSDLK